MAVFELEVAAFASARAFLAYYLLSTHTAYVTPGCGHNHFRGLRSDFGSFSYFYIGTAMYWRWVTYEKCDHRILAPGCFPHIKSRFLHLNLSSKSEKISPRGRFFHRTLALMRWATGRFVLYTHLVTLLSCKRPPQRAVGSGKEAINPVQIRMQDARPATVPPPQNRMQA